MVVDRHCNEEGAQAAEGVIALTKHTGLIAGGEARAHTGKVITVHAMLGAAPAARSQSLSAARRSALYFTVHSVKPEWSAPALS